MCLNIKVFDYRWNNCRLMAVAVRYSKSAEWNCCTDDKTISQYPKNRQTLNHWKFEMYTACMNMCTFRNSQCGLHYKWTYAHYTIYGLNISHMEYRPNLESYDTIQCNNLVSKYIAFWSIFKIFTDKSKLENLVTDNG